MFAKCNEVIVYCCCFFVVFCVCVFCFLFFIRWLHWRNMCRTPASSNSPVVTAFFSPKLQSPPYVSAEELPFTQNVDLFWTTVHLKWDIQGLNYYMGLTLVSGTEKQLFRESLFGITRLYWLEGSNMIFHSLTLARSRGKCWKPRAKPEVFNLPRDLANVNE